MTMADHQGRPILRTREEEQERMRKRLDWLANGGVGDDPSEEPSDKGGSPRKSKKRTPSPEKKSSKEKSKRHRSPSREKSSKRRDRSRDRSDRKKDERSDRKKESRDKEKKEKSDRKRSRSRERRRRSRSRDRRRHSRKRSRSSSSDGLGYQPRQRLPDISYTVPKDTPTSAPTDPFYYHNKDNDASTNETAAAGVSGNGTAGAAAAATAAPTLGAAATTLAGVTPVNPFFPQAGGAAMNPFGFPAAAAAAVPSTTAAVATPAAPAIMTPAQQMSSAQAWILNQQAASALAARGSKKNREVYCGNLLMGVVTPEMLTQLFNSAIGAAFPEAAKLIDPVVGVNMGADLKYCFVEFVSEEMATAALQLDKINLCGRDLNIRRPTGYVDHSLAANMAATAAQQVAAAAAGARAMIANVTGMAAPAAATPAVVPGMPGVPVAAVPLTSEPAAAAVPAAAVPEVAPVQSPDEVLVLQNLVAMDSLNDAAEIQEVTEDLQSECGKHGQLLGVHIVTEQSSPDVGKAFIHFLDISSATQAFNAINGRHFDGHVIVASYTSADKFKQLVS